MLVAGGAGAGVSASLSPALCCQNIKGTPKLKAFISRFLDSKYISYKTGATHRDNWICLLPFVSSFPPF